MSNYFIGVDNTFTLPNSPIVIEVGKKQIIEGYPSIKRLLLTEYKVASMGDEFVSVIKSSTVQCGTPGSYSFLITDLTETNLSPIRFSFYVYAAPQALNTEWLTQLINGLLPNIYNADNVLNNADNVAIANVFGMVYKQLIELFYNAISSVGSYEAYNSQWEFVYIGINNFLQNTKYPAEFLKTMLRISAKTGIKIPDIAIFTSRLAYQITGTPNPVAITYDSIIDVYFINIYANDSFLPWVLGVSLLGVDTILGTATSNQFSYILCKIVSKLIPITVKYQFNFLTMDQFTANFNSTQPKANDYIDPDVYYDAYSVVNNNNIFNTKGYYKNA